MGSSSDPSRRAPPSEDEARIDWLVERWRLLDTRVAERHSSGGGV